MFAGASASSTAHFFNVHFRSLAARVWRNLILRGMGRMQRASRHLLDLIFSAIMLDTTILYTALPLLDREDLAKCVALLEAIVTSMPELLIPCNFAL